jgi:hypothetical protein
MSVLRVIVDSIYERTTVELPKLLSDLGSQTVRTLKSAASQ